MRTLRAIVLVIVFFPRLARADDETPHVTVTPTAGGYVGSWVGLSVSRVVVGAELNHPIGHWIDGSALFTWGAGRSEAGLGTHRLASGYGFFFGPSLLQLGVGIDLTYAMLERATKQSSFWHALGGDIGGFGLGAHAALRSTIPIGKNALVIALRASADVYNGGHGYELGPTLGFRF